LASHIAKTPESRPWRYEQANIEGKEYDLDSFAEITDDLPVFLKNYENLIDHREKGQLIYEGWKFSFNPKKPIWNTSKSKKSKTSETVVTKKHVKMQKALHSRLVSKYGKKYVDYECELIQGKFADLVVLLDSGKYAVYEIKTQPTARECIREAIGQLLEYSYWPGSQSVEQIWVVGPTHMDDKSTEYIESLKSQFGLPIGYVHQPVEDSG
jgi:hypothetical protein